MRSGTENVIALAGLAQAAEEAYELVSEWHQTSTRQKQLLIQLLESSGLPVQFNGAVNPEDALPNTLNLSLEGIRGEALALRLELNHGIQVSTGSACSTNKKHNLSHVLLAMNVSEAGVKGAIRVSFGRYTSDDDVRQLVVAIKQEYSALTDISGSANH